LALSSEKNLEQFSSTEEGAEPVGLEVREVKQEIWKKIEKNCLLCGFPRACLCSWRRRCVHEPAESDSDADRVQKTWDTLRNKLEELSFAVQYSQVTRKSL
jgi:hypothetical protein